jgi:hypothetical protein
LGNLTTKYLFQKRGVFYFERRIPWDLQYLYNKKKIVSSLRTKKRRSAITLSIQLSSKLETYWSSFRLERLEEKFCSQSVAEKQNIKQFDQTLLSESAEEYLRLKGASRGAKVHEICS